MKILINIARLMAVLLLILIFLINSYGCKKDSSSEIIPGESSDTAEEPQFDITDDGQEKKPEDTKDEDLTEENDNEEIKNEIFAALNNFLQAAKEDKEYNFLIVIPERLLAVKKNT